MTVFLAENLWERLGFSSVRFNNGIEYKSNFIMFLAVSYYKGVPSGMWDEETLANFQSSSNCMQDEYNAYNISFENSASVKMRPY